MLKRLGIQGLSIVEFDDDLGPIPKFVHSKHARLIRRILRDRVFSSKISILAKYASEAKLVDDSRIIIETFYSSDERVKVHYIIAQVSEDANPVRVRSFLRNICKRLCSMPRLNKEIVERLIREAL